MLQVLSPPDRANRPKKLQRSEVYLERQGIPRRHTLCRSSTRRSQGHGWIDLGDVELRTLTKRASECANACWQPPSELEVGFRPSLLHYAQRWKFRQIPRCVTPEPVELTRFGVQQGAVRVGPSRSFLQCSIQLCTHERHVHVQVVFGLCAGVPYAWHVPANYTLFPLGTFDLPASSAFPLAFQRSATAQLELTNQHPQADPEGRGVTQLTFASEPLGLPAAKGFGWAQFEFGDQILGEDQQYTITRKLGWGMCSSTWLARDSRLVIVNRCTIGEHRRTDITLQQ